MWWKTALSWIWRLAIVLPPLAWTWLVLYFEGSAGETWGWFRVAVWLVPLAVVPTGLLFLRRTDRRWAVGATFVVACGLATWLTTMAPMGPTRMAAAIDDLDVPGELVRERRSGWDIWGGRPGLERDYRTDADALDAVVAELRADGWTELDVDRTYRHVSAVRDGVKVTAFVDGRSLDLMVEAR